MLNSFNYSLPDDLSKDFTAEIDAWQAADKTARVWSKDASVWTGDDEAKWLGWLTIVDEELADPQKDGDLHSDIESARVTDGFVNGMGGSAPCPVVVALTLGKSEYYHLQSN